LYPVAHRSEIQKPYLDQRVTLFSNRKLRLAIADLLPQDPEERYMEGLVEILKYPTAAGAAADALIERVRKQDATAPGAPAGIQANVAWVTNKFPSVEIVTPPERPQKPSSLTQ